MKILIDTNILISAVLFPCSKPARALVYTTENDKDFLSLDIIHPKCITVAQFLDSEGVEL